MKSLALPLLALKIALIALVALAISVGDDPAGAAEKPSLQVGNVKLTVGMSKADVIKALGNVYALVEIGSHGANLGDYALVAAKGTTREDFFKNPLKTTNEASLWFKQGRVVRIERNRGGSPPISNAYDLARLIFALLEETTRRGDE